MFRWIPALFHLFKHLFEPLVVLKPFQHWGIHQSLTPLRPSTKELYQPQSSLVCSRRVFVPKGSNIIYDVTQTWGNNTQKENMYSIQREMTGIIIYMVNIVLLIVISKVHTKPGRSDWNFILIRTDQISLWWVHVNAANNFGDPLTLQPSAGQRFHLSSEISSHLLRGLSGSPLTFHLASPASWQFEFKTKCLNS